jgi:hypothetical protein
MRFHRMFGNLGWRRASHAAMTFVARAIRLLLILTILLGLGAGLLLWLRPTAIDPAGASLDLAALPGALSRHHLAALEDAPGLCRIALDRAGLAYARAAPRRGSDCGFRDAVAWADGGTREVDYAPARPVLACPLAAALAQWEWSVVQPAAARLLGTTVTRIDHFGSYACRRLYGRASGGWSEHARADAFDVAGFRLADGRRLTIAAAWRGDGAEARFLHAVRDGACRLFGTTLSPDYNAAHRDHLHLDGADRGGFGYCR